MRQFLLVAAIGIVFAAPASAQVAVPGVADGKLAVAPNGSPLVAYVRDNTLEIATRRAGRWRAVRTLRLLPGSTLSAFAAGRSGPVAVVLGPGDRTLTVITRTAAGWRRALLVRRLPPGYTLGWPGLALDRRGLPAVAYTRWHRRKLVSYLRLARIDRAGRVRQRAITIGGFPSSYVAPPAVPVVLPSGAVHVLESYGISGAVGTIEWRPIGKSWTGQFIDGGIGDFPVGPMFASVSPTGTIYAAWAEAFLGTGELPITLAVRGRSIESDFVIDRAFAAGLALTSQGPEVAANEWVSAGDLGLSGEGVVWAGAIVAGGRVRTELDGSIAGLVSSPRGARDLLLATPDGLSWFRSRRRLTVRLSLDAIAQEDGTVAISGRVRGAAGGAISIYRERPGAPRQLAATVRAQAGAFSFVDRGARRLVVYRAVYTEPATGIPYAALLRQAVD